MFTIRVCYPVEADGLRRSHVYEAKSYTINRCYHLDLMKNTKDVKESTEYVTISFHGEGPDPEIVLQVGGPEYGMKPYVAAAVFITNDNGKTIESWKMHDADY